MPGTLTLQVPAGTVTDADGNLNTASNQFRLSANRTVSVSDTSATEGTDETIDFEVRLNGADDCKTATVDWEVAGWTATAGEDYTAATGTLTFLPGETSNTVSISILDDSASEGVETLTLSLTNPSGASFFYYGQTQPSVSARGTILPDEDTDAPSVTLATESGLTPPVLGWFDVFVRFSEPVKGLELSELDITNGSALRMAPTYLFNEHGMTSWRVSVVPDSDFNGNVSIRVPAGAATDTFGNANTASEVRSRSPREAHRRLRDRKRW